MEYIDREILEAVAEGRMSPDEAALRLEQARVGRTGTAAGGQAGVMAGDGRDDQPPGAAGDARPDGADAAPSSGDDRIGRVRITAAARTVRIVGDPSVLEAEIDGPHRAWREGDTLVVSGAEDAGGGFSFRSRRRSHRDWRDWSDLADWRRITEPLQVRVNPRLAVSVDLSAGSLSVLGIEGPVAADLAAGSARLEAVTGPLDVTARAGSLRIQGRLTAGVSRVRCDAGSVSIRLDEGSSVRIRAHVELGRVRFHGSDNEGFVGAEMRGTKGYSGGQSCDVVVGGGDGLLEIEAAMASVDVSAQDPTVSSVRR